MNHLDLFSGIGGFSLGLESVGFETVAFCEIEDYPRRVLKKHWPNVPCYEDVRDVGADRLAADGIERIEIVTGGFPCQDISLAGNREGLSGDRSGLWSELSRVIAEVRPRWAIVENVPGLRTLGADRVLADLAGTGYAAWPLVVGAVHAGAPHRRKRVWIVAHANGNRLSRQRLSVLKRESRQAGDDITGSGRRCPDPSAWGWDWAPEPVLRGVDDGLPCWMDRRERLKALGNAVVPQVVAAIGRAILQADRICTSD